MNPESWYYYIQRYGKGCRERDGILSAIVFIIIIAMIGGIIYMNWYIWDFQTKKIESGCKVATQNYMGQPTRYENCPAEWWETMLAFSAPPSR